MRLMRRLLLTALAVGVAVGGAGLTRVHAKPTQPSQPYRPPVGIVLAPDWRGPQPPQEHPYVAPPASRAPPMERLPEIAPLSPRIEN
jgi:hypothetical protein